MALHVIALPPDEFERWLAHQAAACDRERRCASTAGAQSASRDPRRRVHGIDRLPIARGGAAALVARGRTAFGEHGCASCHAVRARRRIGTWPRSDAVAGRLTLGAGVLDNAPGAAKRWLVGVQQLKPGARMPSYAHLDAETLDALEAYLEQLR